jgi:hypothetical protein
LEDFELLLLDLLECVVEVSIELLSEPVPQLEEPCVPEEEEPLFPDPCCVLLPPQPLVLPVLEPDFEPDFDFVLEDEPVPDELEPVP